MIGAIVSGGLTALFIVWWIKRSLNTDRLRRPTGDSEHKSCLCLCHTEGVNWILAEDCGCGRWIYVPTRYLW